MSATSPVTLSGLGIGSHSFALIATDQAGNAAEELKSSATVTFQPGEGITKIALRVAGVVPNIDEDTFKQAAETAKENCPVSKALASVPEITLDARLQG